MKRILSVLMGAMLLTALMATPAAAVSPSYVTIYEGANKTGDHWQVDRYGDGNVPDLRNETRGLVVGCDDADDIAQLTWNNCVSSAYLYLYSGECIAFYEGLYERNISVYSASTGSRTILSPNVGQDTLSSIRWGTISHGTCVF